MKAEVPQGEDKIYQIKVELLVVKPLVWRRFLIPANVTLHRLHLVLQDVMGWENYHLYEFRIGNDRYSEPDPDNKLFGLKFKNSWKTKLAKVICEKGSVFQYIYDFGDGWRHQLFLEEILDRDPERLYPVCLAGENACPREDSGGPGGYLQKLEISRNPYHREFREIRTWLGKDFDPRKFRLEIVNMKLSRMRL